MLAQGLYLHYGAQVVGLLILSTDKTQSAGIFAFVLFQEVLPHLEGRKLPVCAVCQQAAIFKVSLASD